MTPDSSRKPFSKRHGYRSQPKEITVREDAPENLRHFVLEQAVENGCSPSMLRECGLKVILANKRVPLGI